MIFAAATLAAAGTPQMVATATAPTMPTITMGGVTSVYGGATERVKKATVQADPANAGTNIYVGGAQMNKGTRAGVGLVLAKTAAPVEIGNGIDAFALTDIYFDGDTTGDKLLLVLS